MTKPAWLLALLLAALAVACSDRVEVVANDPASTPIGTVTTPPPGTTGTPAPSATSAARSLPAGLQQILDDVARIRELPAPPALKADVISRDELPALLQRLTTDDDRRYFKTTTTLYRLLGHFRQDQDFETVYNSFGAGSILGLYYPPEDHLWVVSDSGASPDFGNLPRTEKETLAHELTHAIQDFNFKLDVVGKTVETDLDRSFAYTNVIEGDAVTNEGAYSAKFLAGPGSGLRFMLGAPDQAPDVPASFTRELLFPYTTGAAWIKEIRAKEGLKPIDDMLARPPSASSVILHPELRTNGWKPQTVTLPDLAQALGPGWTRESGGTFGEFQVRNYLQIRLRASEAASAATGWAGDHYDVYVNGNASLAAFRIAFSSSKEAEEFAASQQSFLKAARAVVTADGAATVADIPGGATTATLTLKSDVLFVIASTHTDAVRALRAITGG